MPTSSIVLDKTRHRLLCVFMIGVEGLQALHGFNATEWGWDGALLRREARLQMYMNPIISRIMLLQTMTEVLIRPRS